MQTLDWDVVQTLLNTHQPTAETLIEQTLHWIRQYPAQNDNPEGLSRVLSELNKRVMELGEMQFRFERLKNWTERRYEIEKSLEVVRITKEGPNKSVSYAKEAKYEHVQQYLDRLVDASAMHIRVQNARSSARDTTEAIRSRISQIKGAIRSS